MLEVILCSYAFAQLPRHVMLHSLTLLMKPIFKCFLLFPIENLNGRQLKCLHALFRKQSVLSLRIEATILFLNEFRHLVG